MLARIRAVTLITMLAAAVGCRGPVPRLQLSAPKLVLNAGEAATLELGMLPGTYHMVEVAADHVGAGGAEVVLRSGNVEAPPIYFEASEGEEPKFDARVWSPSWPQGEGGTMRVANYGPGSITIDRVRARTGGSDELYRAVLEKGPRAVGWSELKSLQEQAAHRPEWGAPPALEMAGARAWLNQQRRRAAFESISGPPIPVRLAEPLRGNVQVRAAAMGAGAVVGFSRPNPTFWRPLGPGWYPAGEAAKWRPIPADRGMPRGFELRQGVLTGLAIYVANAKSEDGPEAGVEARLFRLDSAEPVAEQKWYDVGSEGIWLELEPDEPQGPGLYIFELKASRGSPMWLAWDAEPQAVPGEEFPRANETIAIKVADPAPEYLPAIDIQALVSGGAGRVDVLRGDGAKTESKSPGIGREIVLRAQLEPGETEIFYLRDYRNPVPAQEMKAAAPAPAPKDAP